MLHGDSVWKSCYTLLSLSHWFWIVKMRACICKKPVHRRFAMQNSHLTSKRWWIAWVWIEPNDRWCVNQLARNEETHATGRIDSMLFFMLNFNWLFELFVCNRFRFQFQYNVLGFFFYFCVLWKYCANKVSVRPVTMLLLLALYMLVRVSIELNFHSMYAC